MDNVLLIIVVIGLLLTYGGAIILFKDGSWHGCARRKYGIVKNKLFGERGKRKFDRQVRDSAIFFTGLIMARPSGWQRMPTWRRWSGHFGCTCYHPLFVFNQYGDLERCLLRAGHDHSAEDWRLVLEPVIARYVVFQLAEVAVPRPVRGGPAPDRSAQAKAAAARRMSTESKGEAQQGEARP
jgi:hypothetical protein